MFNIQYVHPVTRKSALQAVNTKSTPELLRLVAEFGYEILAVYEQGTPITKRTRLQLIDAARAGKVDLTLAAKTFAMEGMRLSSPA